MVSNTIRIKIANRNDQLLLIASLSQWEYWHRKQLAFSTIILIAAYANT